MIVHMGSQVLSPQRMSSLCLFVASKFAFEFQILLLQKGEICQVYSHPNESQSQPHYVLKSCGENNDARLIQFSNRYLIISLSNHQKAYVSISVTIFCTSRQEMANTRSLISAQEKCHLACVSSCEL